MPQPTHIIAHQQVRLNCQRVTDPMKMRNMVQRLCSESLPTELSQLFDRYDDSGMVLRIEKISVDIRANETNDLQEYLTRTILEQVELQLRQHLSKRIEQSLSGSLFDSLLHYLLQGYLPWWAIEKDDTAFREAIQKLLFQEAPLVFSPKLQIILHQSDALQRFLALTEVEVWDALLEHIIPSESASWPEIFDSLAKWMQCLIPGSRHFSQWPEPRRMILERLLLSERSTSMSQPECLEMYASALEQSIGPFSEIEIDQLPLEVLRIAFRIKGNQETELPPKGNISINDVSDSKLQEQEPAWDKLPELPLTDARILIANAGLVLPAPFLPTFFFNLGLAKDNQLIEPSRAARLLHFLYLGAAEEEPSFEHGFVLEKILCGIPLSQSIQSKIEWTERELQESEALLHSVIVNWSALKNTSPDGLRFNFLQREGKLHFTGNEWRLCVQRQAHDILLDRLPWSIGIIKLPWMKAWISVDWAA
ncbi:MAG: hypothetical protein JST27_11090 [Bacteroidetes bacterium]|nr:hypothetical protein [Bacteroidota bacterium]